MSLATGPNTLWPRSRAGKSLGWIAQQGNDAPPARNDHRACRDWLAQNEFATFGVVILRMARFGRSWMGSPTIDESRRRPGR